ncbi:MAG: type II toxin-antitoxin system RelE/ParE family toxin [Limosilactobacillus sp.]|nr:type II toxin-antitoxin system RelE/ParE family toxin [Limosilactobacillus sp.]
MKQINEYLKFAPDNNFGRKFPGNIIEETGGAIKYRFRPSDGQKGKSGSFRIIYFVYNGDKQELVFLNLYAKKDKANLTKREKSVIRQLIE